MTRFLAIGLAWLGMYALLVYWCVSLQLRYFSAIRRKGGAYPEVIDTIVQPSTRRVAWRIRGRGSTWQIMAVLFRPQSDQELERLRTRVVRRWLVTGLLTALGAAFLIPQA